MTAMRLKRYQSPSGGFALGKVGVGATLMNTAKTARDYVQNGLVAMWDGIENAGWGIHDANATTWKDLTDGTPLTIINGVFTKNSIVLTGGTIYGQSIPKLTQAIAAGEATIEYGGVFRPREGLTYSNESTGFKIGGYHSYSWVSQSSTEQGATFWSKENANSASYGTTYPTRYESRWGWDDSMSNHAAPTSVRAGSQQGGIGQRACTVQITIGGGVGNSFVDTTFFNSAMVNTLAAYKKSGFCLGSYSSRSNMEYYFFRLYSRALTAEEIAHNYKIDKERFNLP